MATTATGMPYSGNPDFRGYVAAVAPQYLQFVGNDGGINQNALANFYDQSANPNAAPGADTAAVNKALSDIKGLTTKFNAYQNAPAVTPAAAADPNTDPAHIASLRGNIGNLISAFTTAVQAAYGKVDAAAADKKNQLIQNYTTQQQGLDTNYGNTAAGIDNTEAAHGAFNSSYRANQQGVAQDAYKTATTALGQGEAGDLATVGQAADTQKAQLAADAPAYNPSDYNTVSDLLNVQNAVNTAMSNMKVSAAGIGTQGGFGADLNSIAPTATDTGSTALKAQLDKLANTNAPTDAKTVIAQHAINQAGADPAWLDYFQQQLTGNTSAAPSSGAAVTPPQM